MEKISLNVLCLEDANQDVEIIREQLIDAGYDLSMDWTAEKMEFIELLRKNKYDIVLSDFSLPGFNAFGALQLENDICPDVPFICVSGSIGEETAIELLKKGAVDYILKDRLVRLPFAIKRALDDAKEKIIRRQAEVALQESEKRFQTLAEISPVGIFQTDAEGSTTYVNPRWCEISGMQKDEALGDGWLNAVHIEDKEKLRIGWISASQSRVPSNADYRFIHKDGSIAWVMGQAVPEMNYENNIVGYVGTITDITERKLAEEEIIKAKEKAEEMNRLKSSFLANLSHELRTPLVGILGFAEILSQAVESQELKAMAETIYKSGKRLSETLNLILDISKFETEKWDIKHRKIDLVSKTKEIVDSFEGTANKKGLSLKSSFSHNSIIINFDERAYHSILNNLINNAIKFSSEGSVTTAISFNNDFVELRVIDTGIGIAEQDYQIIFEEFRQVSEGYSRNFEGSGLGLNITKKLIEKFGGTITVESEIGKGTTFKVILPVTNTELKEKELTAREDKKIPKLPKQKSVKPIALLIDDDPFVFTILRKYTSEYIELETSVDAESAIKILKRKQYDLIFMDINLKIGMDGKEATKKIRTMKGYESTPIIATTAYAMVGDKEEFLTAGCTHYLSKPFGEVEITELIDKVLKLI